MSASGAPLACLRSARPSSSKAPPRLPELGQLLRAREAPRLPTSVPRAIGCLDEKRSRGQSVVGWRLRLRRHGAGHTTRPRSHTTP